MLNRLIQTCRDGERGFRYAANHVDDARVKALFLEIATQRDDVGADFRAFLVDLVQRRKLI